LAKVAWVCALLFLGAGECRAAGGDEILPLTLRAVAESDAVLSERYYDPDGFYSIQPPAKWKRIVAAPRGGEKEPWHWRVLFQGTDRVESLEAGVVADFVPLDKESLSRYMGDFAKGLRRQGAGTIESAGLYLYDQYHCILVTVRGKTQRTTWFLVFGEEPVGEHLQLVVRTAIHQGQKVQRWMEAVLASIRWPDLKRGRGEEKNPFPESSR
jgi:hypothetical protein